MNSTDTMSAWHVPLIGRESAARAVSPREATEGAAFNGTPVGTSPLHASVRIATVAANVLDPRIGLLADGCARATVVWNASPIGTRRGGKSMTALNRSSVSAPFRLSPLPIGRLRCLKSSYRS